MLAADNVNEIHELQLGEGITSYSRHLPGVDPIDSRFDFPNLPVGASKGGALLDVEFA